MCNNEPTEKGGCVLVQSQPTGVGRVHSQPWLANQHDDRSRQKLNSHGSGVHYLGVEHSSQGQGQTSVGLSLLIGCHY